MKLFNTYFGCSSWDLTELDIDLRRDEWFHDGENKLFVRRRNAASFEDGKAIPNERWAVFIGEAVDPYSCIISGEYVIPGLEVEVSDGMRIPFWEFEMENEDGC